MCHTSMLLCDGMKNESRVSMAKLCFHSSITTLTQLDKVRIFDIKLGAGATGELVYRKSSPLIYFSRHSNKISRTMIRLLAFSAPHERSGHERCTRIHDVARLEQFHDVCKRHAERAGDVRRKSLRVVFLCLWMNYALFLDLMQFRFRTTHLEWHFDAHCLGVLREHLSRSVNFKKINVSSRCILSKNSKS